MCVPEKGEEAKKPSVSGLFCLPKPKPMRRITLLNLSNATHPHKFHSAMKKLQLFFKLVFKNFLKFFELRLYNI
jgi:hypothetical protein